MKLGHGVFNGEFGTIEQIDENEKKKLWIF